jgi:hypothetical protein
MTDAEADLLVEAVAESIVEVALRLAALPGVR